MADLQEMPQILVDKNLLIPWGERWLANINDETGAEKQVNAFDRKQSVNFASCIDMAFGEALATFLDNGPVEIPDGRSLLPVNFDCVEVGPVRIIGGVRPQNFDAGYRPDGPRVVFDSKSLNDRKSINKNWQNMINDLGTEATTVHTRYPYAIVAFAIILPRPALMEKQNKDIVRTLERLATRENVIDLPHLAEAISLIVWDPATGEIDQDIPSQGSTLRLENMHTKIEELYRHRYQGLPPHN